MTEPFTTSPDQLEARSTAYAQDTCLLRQLASGRWAVYNPQRELLGIVPRIEDAPPLLAPLQRLAREASLRLADERLRLERRLTEAAALDTLALNLDLDLELDL